MAISKMKKIIIAGHRSQASDLLEQLQQEGICQILDAEQAAVTKTYPDLSKAGEKPRNIEEFRGRLAKCISFLKQYARQKGGLLSALAPRDVVDEQAYRQVTDNEELPKVVEDCEQTQSSITKLNGEIENLTGRAEELKIWENFSIPVEQLGQFRQVICWAGLIQSQRLAQLQEDASQAGAAVQQVAAGGNKVACVVVALKETAEQVQKMLRSSEFEPTSFAGINGTIAEQINQLNQKLTESQQQLVQQKEKAAELADNLLKLKILYDHQNNLFSREQTKGLCPATEQTVLLEGWVMQKDLERLEKLVAQFAAEVQVIDPAEGEDIPVEIENRQIIKPFETITRLYGMPDRGSVDPTVFLAPFFALFFGLCLADAAYGLIMIALLVWVVRKMQGDKGIMWMLIMCGVTTALAGAITGSWFSDAITTLMPQSTALSRTLNGIRETLMWFDPMKEPMRFFILSLGLGYVQIQFGFFIALIHNLLKKDFVSAVCDQLTWIVILNCLLGLGLSMGGLLPAGLGKALGFIALLPAAVVLFFSGRSIKSIGGRLGMGVFNLFSAVFFAGDILSYVRLMALGMVGSGFGMAINVLVKIVMNVPYAGWFLGALLFVGGHLFNLALSMLGAFVHSLRLQFVEFFPKFLQGGGKQFLPLRKDYRYIYVEE